MKIAVYAGTFDPITLGHQDILTRAAHLFDKLILAIAVDNYKETFFTAQERVEIARQAVAELPNVEVKQFSGLESGMSTVLVLSGVTSLDLMKTYAYRPSVVLNGVGDIVVAARSGFAALADFWA